MTGSNTAEAEEDTDPSSEAEDRSCCVTATGVSVVGVRGELLVASETDGTDDQQMSPRHSGHGFVRRVRVGAQNPESPDLQHGRLRPSAGPWRR